MLKTGNPIHDFNQWDKDNYDWELSLPMCDKCGEAILDESYYDILGTKYCLRCLDKYKKYVD